MDCIGDHFSATVLAQHYICAVLLYTPLDQFSMMHHA